MTEEPKPFIEYWEAVDAALLKFFGIDTADAGIEPDLIATAQEEGQSPEDFARWLGNKYDLDYLDDLLRRSSAERVLIAALLGIKCLAGKSGDHDADPFALLDLIGDCVLAALAKVTGERP